MIRFGDAQDTRDTGGFFWFVFYPVKENELKIKDHYPGRLNLAMISPAVAGIA